MKFIFIMTHLGSGSNYLCDSLSKVSTISCNHTNKIYTHPTDLDAIKDRYAKTFIDVIEFNYSFASTALYDCCKFIYLVRNPKQSFGNMIQEGYSKESAMSYYLFRLRRMYEMAYHTPGSLFLKYEDMFNKESQKVIAEFLEVNKIPSINPGTDDIENWVPSRGYEKYLTMFDKLDLIRLP